MIRRAAAATVLAVLAAAAPASADSDVVSATIVTGSPGTPVTRTVSLSTMQACPAYPGPDALQLHPGGTDQLTTGATWTVAEIVSCGLQIPLADVTDVAVQRGTGAAETPLSATQLSDPGLYHDPTAPGALPVISSDGGQALNIYTRPWRGGADQNARDQVTAQGPIGLSVYEHIAPLVVDIELHLLHRGTSATRFRLSAKVQTASGTTVPAAALSWHWTLPGARSSGAATPSLTVPLRTTTAVGVRVRDTADGASGTEVLTIENVPKHSSRATHHGGGRTGTTVKTSGLGQSTPAPSHGTRRHGGRSGSAGSAPPKRSTTTPRPTHTSSASTTTAATTTTTAPPTSTTTATTSSTPRPTPARRHQRTPRRLAPSRPPGQLVSGRLIGDLTPLRTLAPAASAPETPQGPAAAATPDVAQRFTVPGAILAGAIVVALLGAGAARERWPHSRNLHR